LPKSKKTQFLFWCLSIGELKGYVSIRRIRWRSSSIAAFHHDYVSVSYPNDADVDVDAVASADTSTPTAVSISDTDTAADTNNDGNDAVTITTTTFTSPSLSSSSNKSYGGIQFLPVLDDVVFEFCPICCTIFIIS